MILSIITINKNNLRGLKKTLESITSQNVTGFEHIIVDGASTDGSIEAIREFEFKFKGSLQWVSEPDNGIYNAMNKGIKMASGKYTMILNSGDCLVNENVVGTIYDALEAEGYPTILYGNMIKMWQNGIKYKGNAKVDSTFTFWDFYRGTLDHDGAIICKDLYSKFGLYDESLKICSDWKWMMTVIGLNEIKPVYHNINIILFDMSGISEGTKRGKELIAKERKQVLTELIPEYYLADYDNFGNDVCIMQRIKRYPVAYRIVRIIERILFKLDKLKNRKCYYR